MTKNIAAMITTLRKSMPRILFVAVMCAIMLSQRDIAQLKTTVAKNDTTNSFISRKTAITCGIAIQSAFAIVLEYRWWWRDNYHSFGLVDEGFMNDYSLGVDKVGHFYTSYFYFNALYRVMKWGGYDESTTLWVSTTIPALYAVSLELGDGFSRYQFAPDDLIGNSLGLAYAFLQAKYSYLKNFNVKWSYIPSEAYRGRFNYPITNDYDGHIYWLSLKIHNLLPEPMKQYWPKFLNLTIGYGSKNASIGSSGPMKRKFAIALDYNLAELPLNGDTWDMLKNIFDLFHFPAPGLRYIDGERPQFKPLLLN